jgi:hypothetical protein
MRRLLSSISMSVPRSSRGTKAAACDHGGLTITQWSAHPGVPAQKITAVRPPLRHTRFAVDDSVVEWLLTEANPAISIYMPVDLSQRDLRALSARLKNLLRAAEDTLRHQGGN